MQTIGILGFGNMGGALAAGLARSGADWKVVVREVKAERAAEAQRAGCELAADAAALFGACDITFLAVKPQEWANLQGELSGLGRGRRVVSMMAGVGIRAITRVLGSAAVARIMANLAAVQGKALVGVSLPDDSPGDFRESVLAIVRAIGEPMEVPERLMGAVTGISGSGIAFAFQFIHAMALGGVAAGIAYPSALKAALAVVEGAAAVIRATGETPTEWIARVVSPAGTTIRGIEALEAGGFTHATMQAVLKASERALELEG